MDIESVKEIYRDMFLNHDREDPVAAMQWLIREYEFLVLDRERLMEELEKKTSLARLLMYEKGVKDGSAAASMPWLSETLESWDIAGMNHYYVNGERLLFVAMTKKDGSIRAEGGEEAVWQYLEDAARGKNQANNRKEIENDY